MKLSGYSIIDDVTHNLNKAPQYWWKIKPSTSGDELAMQRFLLQNRSNIGPDGVRREFPPTVIEVAYREIASVFKGTNIPKDENKPVEEGGEPILKENASIDEIEKVLMQMPHELVDELWDAITEANPSWGTCPKVTPRP